MSSILHHPQPDKFLAKVYPSTNKVPIANQALLKAAGLTPMALSAIESFEPLEENQIRTKISEQSLQKDNEIITFPFEDELLTGKEHFTLILDQAILEKNCPVRITNCRYFTIQSSLSLITPSHHNKFFIEITGCSHFTIKEINCAQGRNMLFISDSSIFTISSCSCSDAEGAGIIIHKGNNFRISGCFFHNNLSTGILIIGHSYNGEVRDCICSRSRGYFNQDAGIHLCCTSQHVTSAHIPEQYHEPLPITSKQQRPHHILIKNCTITHCRAQGIYLEGAINCLIEDNVLVNNNKEGICFDWGSCYNIFNRNMVSLNGERRRLSPEEIQADFISEYPLLEDGSSSMKLPGISLDNGCLNLIEGNKITNNYGGGVKMIRTALFNKITNNQILYNTIGANSYVPCFHGITILGCGAINNEFNDSRSALLDFMPSILNTITHNTIKEHWDPIFHDRISSNNFASDNITPLMEHTRTRLTAIFSRAKAFAKRLLKKKFQNLIK